MQEIKTIKDVEYVISRAVWTDRKLPKVGLKTAQSQLGRIIAPDDTERCLDDIMADIPLRERPTQEDLRRWWFIMSDVLPRSGIDLEVRDIILKKRGGMGFTRIAYENNSDRTTIWRKYKRGIADIFDFLQQMQRNATNATK